MIFQSPMETNQGIRIYLQMVKMQTYLPIAVEVKLKLRQVNEAKVKEESDILEKRSFVLKYVIQANNASRDNFLYLKIMKINILIKYDSTKFEFIRSQKF